MARQLGFTRARVTQLMELLLLAPEVQEEVLFLELLSGAQPVSERGLREAVLGTIDWQEQSRRWERLKAVWPASSPAEKVQILDFRGRMRGASDGWGSAARGTKKDVMATADQDKALIRSHADGDDTRPYAIAMQVSAPSGDARSAQGDGT